MDLDNLVIVTKRTDLEELLLQHATISQAKFYMESRGEDFSDYLYSHRKYKSTLNEVIGHLPKQYSKQNVDKSLVATHQFSEHDIIIVIGDPGLFVNVAKYINNQPVICVNSNPLRYADVFTTCNVKELSGIINQVALKEAETEYLTLAEAVLDDGQKMLALNDFFIGQKTHVSAHYTIKHEGKTEKQSSSGIIVSTGTGSTAWRTAIIAGAYGLTDRSYPDPTFSRSAKHLEYMVREPFPTKTTGCSLVHGSIFPEDPLIINSHMPENGVIFSDGIEKDYIDFNAGASVEIRPAEEQVQLVKG